MSNKRVQNENTWSLEGAESQTDRAADPSKSNAPVPLLMEQAMSQLGDDRELLLEVVEMFIDSLPRLLDNLKAASDKADAAAIAALAHSIKGAASNICAEPIRATAAALEQDGRSGHVEGAQAAVTEMCQEFDEFKEFVETLS